MAVTIAASELHAGDHVRVNGRTVSLHRVPIDRSQRFTAGWMRVGREGESNGEITFEPDEQVEVFARFPERVVI